MRVSQVLYIRRNAFNFQLAGYHDQNMAYLYSIVWLTIKDFGGLKTRRVGGKIIVDIGDRRRFPLDVRICSTIPISARMDEGTLRCDFLVSQKPPLLPTEWLTKWVVAHMYYVAIRHKTDAIYRPVFL